MEKVLAVGAATMRLRAPKADPELAEAPQAEAAPVSGNAMCPVLFLEMVDFSRKPVADQLVLRERFNGRVARALEQVPLLDRMVLETGDGVAITFLAGPEAALHVALRFAHSLQPTSGSSDPLQVRGGINIGPVRLTKDANGHALVLGDGISVAQRLLGFAAPGQYLVSRAFHEALCLRVPALKGLFLYQGSRTDTHVREHEVYELDAGAIAAAQVPPPAPAAVPGTQDQAGTKAEGGVRRHLALAGAAISAALLLAAVLARVLSSGQDDAVPAHGARPASAERPLVLRQTPIDPSPIAQPVAAEPQSAAPAGEPAPPTAAAEAHVVPDSSRPVKKADGGTRARPPAPATKTAQTSPAPGRQRPSTAPAPVSPATEPAAAQVEASAEAQPASAPAPSGGYGWSAPAPITPPEAAAARKAATALVLFAISPWGEVYVDGRKVGVSPPLTELELPQGKHRIVVRNGEFKPFDEEFELGSNQTLRIKHKFVRR